ncbi:hypothetical protein BDF19DRAFT_431039 [Syncephalis fuscata]|nr:hypothetical protein BDF19DRAFT_431039 [Syncephalis fuscata]
MFSDKQAPGRKYIQRPLSRFIIPRPPGTHTSATDCYIHEKVQGVPLGQFIAKKTWEEKAVFLPDIFYKVTQAIMYWRSLNIMHAGITENTIMVEQITADHVRVKVYDYTRASILVGQNNNVFESGKLSTLKELSSKTATEKCYNQNVMLSIMVYYAITGAYPPVRPESKLEAYRYLQTHVQSILDPSSTRSSAILNNPKQNPSEKFKNVWNQTPQYPTVANVRAVKQIFPLIQTIEPLFAVKNTDCTIPSNVLHKLLPPMRPIANMGKWMHNKFSKPKQVVV